MLCSDENASANAKCFHSWWLVCLPAVVSVSWGALLCCAGHLWTKGKDRVGWDRDTPRDHTCCSQFCLNECCVCHILKKKKKRCFLSHQLCQYARFWQRTSAPPGLGCPHCPCCWLHRREVEALRSPSILPLQNLLFWKWAGGCKASRGEGVHQLRSAAQARSGTGAAAGGWGFPASASSRLPSALGLQL